MYTSGVPFFGICNKHTCIYQNKILLIKQHAITYFETDNNKMHDRGNLLQWNIFHTVINEAT